MNAAALCAVMWFTTAAWPGVDETPHPVVVTEVPSQSETPAVSQAAGPMQKLCHAVQIRLWPMAGTGYVPGEMPYPAHSWYKHSYLAYRGNYFRDGFDYRRQYNYPSHAAYASQCSACLASGSIAHHEAIPVPVAEPGHAAPSLSQPPRAPQPE